MAATRFPIRQRSDGIVQLNPEGLSEAKCLRPWVLGHGLGRGKAQTFL